jgi:hypothetical protein
VRPDHRAEGEAQVGPVAQRRGEAVGAADDEGGIAAPLVAPAGDLAGKVGRGKHLPAFVQRHDHRALRDGAKEKLCLSLHPAAAAVLDLVLGQGAQAQRAARAVEAGHVIVAQHPFRAGTQPAHGADGQPHQAPAGIREEPVGSHIFSSW